jgi:dinuclear metal center YbgI/SA1388 family protein
MIVRDVVNVIKRYAEENSQAGFDNTGLQIGSLNSEVTGVLLCVDVTDAVVEEALSIGANLIISHHPFLFNAFKLISEETYKGALIHKIIRSGLTIYAAHTNMDVSPIGLNIEIAIRLGLEKIRFLDDWAEEICAFTVHPAKNGLNEALNGLAFERTEGDDLTINGKCFIKSISQITYVFNEFDSRYEFHTVKNASSLVGIGAVGDLPIPAEATQLIESIKVVFNTAHLRVSSNYKSSKPITRIALVSGSGSSYFVKALVSGAEMFITSDTKMTDFLTAYEQGIILVSPTHFESEFLFCEVVQTLLTKFLSGLDVTISDAEDIEEIL